MTPVAVIELGSSADQSCLLEITAGLFTPKSGRSSFKTTCIEPVGFRFRPFSPGSLSSDKVQRYRLLPSCRCASQDVNSSPEMYFAGAVSESLAKHILILNTPVDGRERNAITIRTFHNVGSRSQIRIRRRHAITLLAQCLSYLTAIEATCRLFYYRRIECVIFGSVVINQTILWIR